MIWFFSIFTEFFTQLLVTSSDTRSRTPAQVPMLPTMDRFSNTDPSAIPATELDRHPASAPEARFVSAGTESQVPSSSHSGGLQVAPQQETQSRPNTGDRRAPREDRRDHGDRRTNSLRRGRDRQRNAAANGMAYFGTILCALSVAVGTYAFVKAPITFTPSPACADGFGGQRIEHRGLSALWALVMVLAAAGLVIPDRKRRPVLLMILCGVSVGLFAGAYFTVGSKYVGFCID
jgi:hypothetical protein